MIRFIRYRKIYFIFSAVLILASAAFLIVFGLKPGIDFTGGTILEIEYETERPSGEQIRQKLSGLELGTIYAQPTGEKGFILRMREIDDDLRQKILNELRQDGAVLEQTRFELIGSVIGKELKRKTGIVIALALIAIVVYIAIAFRRVQTPLKSWQYGIATIIALFHDILIPLGVFSVLGKFYGVEITIPVVTALLAVLGYSVNNTVVVFDRIRENLFKRGVDFEETVDISVNQTLGRQINTSLTTLFVVLAVFFFGGQTLKYFSLILILGLIAGAYSSIFLASPLLVSWLGRKRKS